ncbi:MAG: GAF domain-containing sensor histidine kinase [Candidatus Blackburnbacteria bacterium]|nr:GAF domain-containing sensor histidine kinase [Candidatus Blackburnbacteria bacterium]
MTKSSNFVKAPVPVNEKDRLRTLYGLHILDTPTEERFDRITKLALDLFNVPISTVTLVDSHREWFKSCQGLPNREGKRAISFCGHAVLSEDIFIIEDATKDPRFAGNPMVTKKPFIKFYAGVSLKAANGQKVGAFCIKDHKPRSLTAEEIDSLKSLASWAELELNVRELSQALKARKSAENKVVELNNTLKLLNKMLTHDLLNDLTVVKGLTDLYFKSNGQNEKSKIVSSAVTRSVNLVKQMRQLEAALEHNAPLKMTPIRDVLGEVLKLFTSIKFNVSGEGNVLADDALFSVIENIIRNAQVHGQTKRIDIVIKKEKDCVKMRIADFGKGIPDEIKKQLFVEGFKYGPTGNSGLGLYIAKKIIERYGGEILVEDNIPKGAVFVIKFIS